MQATISGRVVHCMGSSIEAFCLNERLKFAIGNPEPPKGYYYLPRQNKPNGITGDGAFKFDLEECSDFVLQPVTCDLPEHQREKHFHEINLYGRAS